MPAKQGMGGIAFAGTFAPVYDAEKRPITAGGFVDTGTVVFEDITKAAGLDSWNHVMGTPQKKYILETSDLQIGSNRKAVLWTQVCTIHKSV